MRGLSIWKSLKRQNRQTKCYPDNWKSKHLSTADFKTFTCRKNKNTTITEHSKYLVTWQCPEVNSMNSEIPVDVHKFNTCKIPNEKYVDFKVK